MYSATRPPDLAGAEDKESLGEEMFLEGPGAVFDRVSVWKDFYLYSANALLGLCRMC